MKIMRSWDGSRNLQLLEAPSANVNYAVLFLQRPFDHKNLCAMEQRAICLENIGSDYRIGYSRFVFDRQKEKTFGRSRTLTHDYHARYLYPCSVVRGYQILCAEYALRLEMRPQMRH